jgi:hypothetical protein
MSKFNAWMDKMLVDVDNYKVAPKTALKSTKSTDEYAKMIELYINGCINDVKLLELTDDKKYITEANIKSLINFAIQKKIVSLKGYLEKLIKNKECSGIIDKAYCKIMIVLAQQEALAKTNLNIMMTKAAINKYDDENAKKDPKYTRFDDNDKQIEDTNPVLDDVMEGMMKIKLELETDDKPVVQTEANKALMKERERLLAERRNKYADRKKLLYDAINKYDSVKKSQDPEFKSFQELNEIAIAEEDKFLQVAEETKVKHERLGREEYKPNKYRDTSCDNPPETFDADDNVELYPEEVKNIIKSEFLI